MSYECTFICSPELDSAKLEDVSAKVLKIIETAGGTIKNLQQLGKKKAVKKQRGSSAAEVKAEQSAQVKPEAPVEAKAEVKTSEVKADETKTEKVNESANVSDTAAK